jgi:hypothetical protein
MVVVTHGVLGILIIQGSVTFDGILRRDAGNSKNETQNVSGKPKNKNGLNKDV